MKRKLITLLALTASFILIDALYSGARAYAQDAPRAGEAYIVRERDNLFRIAERAYGNGFDYYRILEANPWIDPDRLIPGKRIEIPAIPAPTSPVPPESLAEELQVAGALEPAAPVEEVPQPPAAAVEKAPPEPVREPPAEEPQAAPAPAPTPAIHADPAQPEPKSRAVWNTLQNKIQSKTFFGLSLEMFACYVLLFCLAHAILQGLIVWIASHITFVREASIRKSFKASFLTEMITFCALVIVGVVAIMMLYVGTENAAEASSSQLFPIVEDYLGRPVGLLVVAGCLLGLHVLLSLRFIPQIFEIQKVQAFMVVLLGVLAPHLAGFYLFGKKMGFIQA